jgi:hydroxypyruvate reductase
LRKAAGGLINVKRGHAGLLKRIAQRECGHPVPDAAGESGAREIAEIAAEAHEGDLLVCLISGGASALLPLPAPGLTLADKQAVTELLLASGANIHEMNTVRKQLSAIKGGRLAALAAPARVLTLVLSDVIGDNLDIIGSGPTWPNPTTRAEARAVLDHYGLTAQLPAPVRAHLEQPEDAAPAPAAGEWILIGSNRQALDAAAAEAAQRGYQPLPLSARIEGETREIARMHAAIAKDYARIPSPQPWCILSGGETTVTLSGADAASLGGRNQEFVLAAAIDLAGEPGITMLSAGTDGTDGPTDAAGAIADGETVLDLAEARLHLRRHDAYHYLDRAGALLRTGPTGTNVMDLRLFLVNPRP